MELSSHSGVDYVFIFKAARVDTKENDLGK